MDRVTAEKFRRRIEALEARVFKLEGKTPAKKTATKKAATKKATK